MAQPTAAAKPYHTKDQPGLNHLDFAKDPKRRRTKAFLFYFLLP